MTGEDSVKDAGPRVEEEELSGTSTQDEHNGTSEPAESTSDHSDRDNDNFVRPPLPPIPADPSAYDYDGEVAELQLTPHVSRASSASRSIHIRKTQTNTTTGTARDPNFEVDFEEGEKGNPRNWSLWVKALIILSMSYGTTTV